jgi:hypothetical protein
MDSTRGALCVTSMFISSCVNRTLLLSLTADVPAGTDAVVHLEYVDGTFGVQMYGCFDDVGECEQVFTEASLREGRVPVLAWADVAGDDLVDPREPGVPDVEDRQPDAEDPVGRATLDIPHAGHSEVDIPLVVL